MSKKLLARIGLLVIVLFGVTILTFFYTNLSPVDAAEALAVRRYNRPTPQQVELVRGELGLDQPILQQYGSWLWNALHGDFGNSYNTGRPIVEELSASIRPTLVMAAMALLFATLLSIPLGVLSASRKGGLADRSIYLFGIICMSLPNYWIGFMLLLAFAVYIPVFSIMGADTIKAGEKRNGNLRFTLRPIQEVMDEYYARQMEEMELAAERQRVAKLLTEQESPA